MHLVNALGLSGWAQCAEAQGPSDVEKQNAEQQAQLSSIDSVKIEIVREIES